MFNNPNPLKKLSKSPQGGVQNLPYKVKPSPESLAKVRSGIKPRGAGMDFSKLDATKKPTTDSPERSQMLRALQGQTNQVTGNRVYNGSAPSPHAGGGLNKSGFNKRDQTARTKKDFLTKQLKSGGF